MEPAKLDAKAAKAVDDAIARHSATPGGLLPMLHAVQDALGYVPPEALPAIAHALNLSRADVHGVASFYHDFRTRPPGRHVVKMCRAEACQAVGGNDVIAHAQRTLGVDFHGTTPDGKVTLEAVYCLGNCALGPALLIDGQLRGRVDAARFDEIIAETK